MSSIEGFIDYQRREFCRAVSCPVQILLDAAEPGSETATLARQICQNDCLHTCHEFHAWLNQQGFVVVRPA